MFYKICVIKNFAKLLGKHQFRSLFIIKLQVSILLLQAFSDNFVSITDIFFAYHLQATASVSWKVILPIKWKLLVRKTTEHAGTKKKHYLHQLIHILLLFKNWFIPLFSASRHTLKAHVFRNNNARIEDLSTIENYFSPLVIWLEFQ